MLFRLNLIASFAAGIASHLAYFNRNEHHLYGIKYLQAFIILFTLSTAKLYFYNHETFFVAFLNVWLLATCYISGLYLSLLSYRIIFSPLKEFPGPFGARISNLWFSTTLRKHDAHRQLLTLHNKYGDFLRIGSSELSIIHPKAVQAIYGFGSKCTKAEFYDTWLPRTSLFATRDRGVHDQHRRLWSAAFGDKALRGYEERIKKYQNQLVDRLFSFDEQSVNATEWFMLYSWDVLGDLAYGDSFNMLENIENHWLVELMHKGLQPHAVMLPMWLFRAIVAIPFAARGWFRFINFCSQKLDERAQKQSGSLDAPDIMAALLKPWKGELPTGSALSMLQGDAELIIVAGSDTTATTLTNLFYELARAPSQLSKLRDEISPLADENGQIAHQKLQYLEHLNAVINETLRLHPPVGVAMPRFIPPEGISIEGTFIPGNTTVWCPQYVVGRNEKIYTDAQKFIPERWYSRPEMIRESGAFAPFSTGTYNCIGKPLALLNLRTTIARLILEFDFEFAPGDDGTAVERDATSQFTAAPGVLNLRFVRRLSSNRHFHATLPPA